MVRYYSFLHMKFSTIAGVLVGGLLCLVAPGETHATSVSTITFSVVDEFNVPLTTRIPQVEVGNCSIESVGAVKAINAPGQFSATVIWKDYLDRSCSLTVGARGFVTGGTQETGTLEVGATKNISTTFRLSYPLVVSLFDAQDVAVNNVAVEFGGIGAAKSVGNNYYFSETGTKKLEVHADGYGNVAANTALQGVLVTSDAVTRVTLQGATPCTVVSTNLTCAAVRKPLMIKVVDSNGVLVTDAAANIYRDLDFTNLLTAQTGGNMQFALPPGTFRGKIVNRNYKDHLFTVTVGSGVIEKVVIVEKINGSRVSPQDSRMYQVGSFVADGSTVSQLQVEVVGGDSTSTRLRDVKVEVKSNRGTVDVISIPENVTNSSGIVTAFITSTRMGTAYFDVFAGGEWIGTQKLYFGEPPLVSGISADAKRTTITTTVSPILADGVESVTVTVTARAVSGARIQGAKVSVASNRAGDKLVPKDAVTDERGEAQIIFTTKTAGTAWVSATIGGVAIEEIGVISVSPLVL